MPDTQSSPKGFVLIAEDVEVISRKMTAGLEACGYKVALAVDGEECLQMAQSLLPDLIILDIMMPKMHGIEVLKQIRADPRTKNIGAIVCTAKSFETELSLVAALGAYDFLIKPFDLSTLTSMVGGFFEARQGTEFLAVLNPPTSRVDSGEIFHPTIESKTRHMTLWGTRGSTPTPGATFLRHGGQTSCMSVMMENEICIFDAGTGIRDLGLELMKSKIRTVHLFMTHTHWDHIQGFPFFAPAYDPSFKITIYAAKGFGKDIESLFSGHLDKDYFPVQLVNLKAALNFVQIGQEPVELPCARVTWEFTNHPGATVGYKIDVAGNKIAWVPDNEFLEGYTGAPDLISLNHERVAPYQKMIEFLTGIDLLIHEAQYTNEEYLTRIGWGHSSLSNACLLARLASVPRWIIVHHDPMHDDNFLEFKLNLTRQLLDRDGHSIPVSHGYDGMTEFLPLRRATAMA